MFQDIPNIYQPQIFTLMSMEFGDNSFKFLFHLRTNAHSNEGDLLKNENDLEA
jgi:hypothetical protein